MSTAVAAREAKREKEAQTVNESLIAPETPNTTNAREDEKEKTLRNGPNIAIRRKFELGLGQLSLHVLSTSFTCVVLALCIANVYFADLTRPNLNMRLSAFQFVARFREFLITASLGSIVLYHLRYELIASKSGLSYGLVASGYQLSGSQFLFSRSFWTAATSKIDGTRTRIVAVLLLVNWWSMKDFFSGTSGLTFLAGNTTSLWPPFLDASVVPEECDPMDLRVATSCPYAFMEGLSLWPSDWINNQAEPNMTIRSSTGSTRYLTASYPNNRTCGYAVAATAMDDHAKDLGALWVYSQLRDLELANAGRPLLSMSLAGKTRLMKPLIQLMFNPGRPDYPAQLTSRVNASVWHQRTDLQFNWTAIPAAGARPVLGALVGMTFDQPYYLPNFQNSTDKYIRGLMACTVDYRWAPTSVSLEPLSDNIVILSDPDPAEIVSSPVKMAETQDLHIDLSYAYLNNAPLRGSDPAYTVTEYILSWFYVAPGIFDGWWGERWPWMIASALSLQMADAVAWLTYNESMALIWHQSAWGKLDDGDSYTINLANMDHFGGIFNYTNQETVSFPDYARARPDQFTEVAWTIRRFGYAWSFHSPTLYLATVVVVLHMAFVVAHISIVVVRGWHCTSWSTVTELLSLVMQSPPATILAGTGAGIQDPSTYAHRVGIRESEDGNSAILVVQLIAV